MDEDEIIATSNAKAFIPAGEGKKIYKGQEEGFLLEPDHLSIRQYKGKTYTKKDGTVSQYYTYKVKEGRSLAPHETVSLSKNICVGRMSTATSKPSKDKEQRRLYVTMESNLITIVKLELVVSQIAFKLITNFTGAGSWGDDTCSGKVSGEENKVIVQYLWQTNGKGDWREYGFTADIKKNSDDEYEVYNQSANNKKSRDISLENDLTGVYEV